METKLIESIKSTIRQLYELLGVMKTFDIEDMEKGSYFIRVFCFLNYKIIYGMKTVSEGMLIDLLQPRDPQGDRVLTIRK